MALNARAQGLATHLLSRQALESLAEAADLPALARALARAGADLEPVPDNPDLDDLELAIRRTAGRHLRMLRRWQAHAPGVLDVFDADQDRRSLRALLRGALQGAPAAARQVGLLPTPNLPARLLTELAQQPSALAVVMLLNALGYPDAEQLLPHVKRAQPELFAIDVTLLAILARRARRAASGGDATLRGFVQERIDAGNIQNALLMAGGPRDIDPAASYVEGGRWLPRPDFVAAAGALTAPAALTALSSALADTPLSTALPLLPHDAAHVERAFLLDMLQRLSRLARREPLGSAPVLRVLLRIEAQSRDLRTIAWGALLGAPPATRKEQLVTPWR